jgi:manganese efflux pump family protein
MDYISLFIIAIGLTFDTFAVSITTGLVANHIRFWQATRIALVMAFFQALMPFIGWFIGIRVKNIVSDYDHWIAFILLFFIGSKMIWESLKKDEEKEDFNPFKTSVLIGMSIATSIDALIVGVSIHSLSN